MGLLGPARNSQDGSEKQGGMKQKIPIDKGRVAKPQGRDEKGAGGGDVFLA